MLRKPSKAELDRIREVFSCDFDVGILINRVKRSGCSVGTAVGYPDKDGYLVVTLDRRQYKVHHIVWFLAHGVWPEDEIDHRYGVRPDNRLSELRPCVHAENHQNRGISRVNTSGVTGVYWHKLRGKWMARIKKNGKTIYLGLFDDIDLAEATYLKAKAELHTFQPTPRAAVEART